MNWLHDPFNSLQFGWRDAVDILVVAFIVYTILRLIRGTKAIQIILGIAVLGVGYLLARWLDLITLESLFRQFLLFIPFAIIILFQHEIREALATFGRNPLLLFSRRHESTALDEIVRACEWISQRRYGALIVLQRSESLRQYAMTGRVIDGQVSAELLLNIFTPNTPLHDGAVIIEGERIAAAAALLPLTAAADVGVGLGTRHRAAIGMSEDTDAFVVVVSEENQAISAAFDGSLRGNLTPETLAELLRIHVGPREEVDRGGEEAR